MLGWVSKLVMCGYGCRELCVKFCATCGRWKQLLSECHGCSSDFICRVVSLITYMYSDLRPGPKGKKTSTMDIQNWWNWHAAWVLLLRDADKILLVRALLVRTTHISGNTPFKVTTHAPISTLIKICSLHLKSSISHTYTCWLIETDRHLYARPCGHLHAVEDWRMDSRWRRRSN